jgi:multidrug resistance efflux pump
MNRRQMLWALPVVSLTGSAESAHAAAARMLRCCAPDDVTVTKLLVPDGKVKTGQALVTLSSIQLDRYKARVDTLTQMLAIEERPFLDGRADQALDLMKQEVAAAQSAFKTAQDVAQATSDALQMGQINPTEAATAAIELEDRRAELATINNESAVLPKAIQDAKERLAVSKQQLATEKTALDALSSRMTIVAPKDGVFNASVGEGGFVKKPRPGNLWVTVGLSAGAA